MWVEVNKTMKGSPDGIQVNTYEAGKKYQMPKDLGVVFVREQWGVECEDPAVAAARVGKEAEQKAAADAKAAEEAAKAKETKKAKKAAAENKSVAEAPENK